MATQSSFYDDRPEDLDDYIRQINQNRHPLSLLLAGITDVRNIGSLFRLADAARLAHIYFLGEASILENKKIQRVARSTLNYVPYSAIQLKEAEALSEQHSFIGLEITDQSIPYTEVWPQKKTVLVIGQEAHGIPAEVLELCKETMHLPMYGVNTSMNVAMATGIAVYDQIRKIRAQGSE